MHVIFFTINSGKLIANYNTRKAPTPLLILNSMSRRLPSRLPSQYPLNLSMPDSAAGTSAVTGVPPPVLSPQHTGALTMSVVSDSASSSDGSITPRRASISADSLTEGDIPGILDPGRLYKV